MTPLELIKIFESVYGEKYTGPFRDVMHSYLNRFRGEVLDTVSEVVILRYSRRYGKAPGPAEIEDHLAEIYITDRKKKEKAIPPPASTNDDPLTEESLKKHKEIFNNLKTKFRPTEKECVLNES